MYWHFAIPIAIWYLLFGLHMIRWTRILFVPEAMKPGPKQPEIVAKLIKKNLGWWDLPIILFLSFTPWIVSYLFWGIVGQAR